MELKYFILYASFFNAVCSAPHKERQARSRRLHVGLRQQISSNNNILPSSFRKRSVEGRDFFDTVANDIPPALSHPFAGVKPPYFAPIDMGRPNLKENSSKKPDIPQFMLDVFDRFEQDTSMQPYSKIIRSFPSKADKELQRRFGHAFPDCIQIFDETCFNKRLLLFDVSSIPSHEQLARAELRLYRKLSDLGAQIPSHAGIHVTLQIAERKCSALQQGKMNRPQEFCKPGMVDVTSSRLKVIESRQLVVYEEGWETFELTEVLRSWVRRDHPRQIEIYISATDSTFGTVDIEIDPSSTNEPLLVAFFADTRRNRRIEHVEEMKEISQQLGMPVPFQSEGTDLRNKRAKRSPESILDIKIGGIRIPVVLSDDKTSEQQPKTATKRTQRSTHHNFRCHREEMLINFDEIGLPHYERPKTYQAYKCVGSCILPLTGDTTKHAIIQSSANLHFPETYEAPCCVPTKLGPISVLYYVETGDTSYLEYKYEYDDMQVLECGCR